MSFDELVQMRENLNKLKTDEDSKDHLFRNKYVYD